MIVRFNPPESDSGLVSYVTWQNHNMEAAMRLLFDCKPNEVIKQVDIEPNGIKAYFEHTY